MANTIPGGQPGRTNRAAPVGDTLRRGARVVAIGVGLFLLVSIGTTTVNRAVFATRLDDVNGPSGPSTPRARRSDARPPPMGEATERDHQLDLPEWTPLDAGFPGRALAEGQRRAPIVSDRVGPQVGKPGTPSSSCTPAEFKKPEIIR